MKWANLEIFLEIVYNYNRDFKRCPKKLLYKNFKNNEYYIIKHFCEINHLITFEYSGIELTPRGIKIFNILKEMRFIYI